MDRDALERALADLATFEAPRPALEQYSTPADLASRLLHLATLNNDLDRLVIDLGTGTGILAIGAALVGAPRVLGIDRDQSALTTARENERRHPPQQGVHWVRGDATDAPLAPTEPVTVVANPPFGTGRGTRHADRAFLGTARELAVVSYTIHNEDSLSFVEAYAEDNGGTVTHAYASEIMVPHQFPWHTSPAAPIPVEVVRVEWST
ncbi:MAG: METTL5 family protein [Halobacteriaceae archaeon]